MVCLIGWSSTVLGYSGTRRTRLVDPLGNKCRRAAAAVAAAAKKKKVLFFFLFYYYLCGQIGQYKRRYIDELEDLIENTRPEPAHINMELGP